MKQKLFRMVLMLVVGLSFGLVAPSSEASTAESGRGWLWGGEGSGEMPTQAYEGTGWWSLNNIDCDTNDSGAVDAADTPNPACPSGAVAKYGVNIPKGDGNLFGYAWSEHYGWMSFNAADVTGCPSGGTCAARREGNALRGWARIMSIKTDLGQNNSGGWSGWVALSSQDLAGATASFGVTVAGSALSGFAYSDELGWINFSGASIVQPLTLRICRDTDGDGNGCGNNTPVDGSTISLNNPTTFSACLTPTDDCSDPTSQAVGTTWTTSQAGRLPVSPTNGNTTTATPVAGDAVAGIKIEAIVPSYAPKSFLADLACTPDWTGTACEHPERVCAGVPIGGQDNRCHQNCTAFGTKNCNSNWSEVAP